MHRHNAVIHEIIKKIHFFVIIRRILFKFIEYSNQARNKDKGGELEW